ncbi:apolipoprotein N-acyltransferase [Cohaesibacter celericrescens]|uniref:apolipoprotein N-acyltransferase n=1 Tax=Cohaesibacter celericrescens TaxID=2067669 RepID=UPI003564654C
MPHFISNLIFLDGWRRHGLAFVAGAVASLAQPPLALFPLLWVCVPLLVWLLDSASLGKNFKASAWAMAKVGWLFGFGFFLVTFYWLGAAFLVEADKFVWALPLAILLLPAGLALFWAMACGLSAWVWSASPLRVIWLALALSAMEWMRGTVLTGLPWGGFAPALASNSVMMQALALVGPNTMTLFAVLLFGLPVFLFGDHQNRRLGWQLATVTGLLFIAQLTYGAYRLAQPMPQQDHASVVRLVQPNIPQVEKWKFENRSWIFNRLIAMTTLDSEETPVDSVDLVIWPESAIPFYLIEDPEALATIAQALPEDTGLITGALRRERSEVGGETVYNSIYQMASDGTVLSAYDKVHLVPFGEYLPKQSWLKAIGLEQLTAQKSGFTAGTNRRLLRDVNLGTILPLICYEIAFSDEVQAFPEGADWIINVTNDAWFGATIGPKQHLHLAQMRAVESGLPVIRAANTGVSAIISGKGQILHQMPLETEGIIQGKLPSKLPITLYKQWGNWIFASLWAFLYIATASIRRKLR